MTITAIHINPLKSDRKAYANGNDITDAIYTYKISYAGVNGASNSNPKTYDSRVGLTLANPVATTKFDGWTLNGEKVTEISIRTKGDITLTANWKEGFYATAKTAAAGSLKSWLENQTGVGPFNVNITGTLTSDYLSAIVTVLKTYPKKLVKLDLSETTGLTELNGFLGCESLETIIIPDGVKTIGAAAFGNCSNLTDITLPGSIESINTTVWGSSDGAFNGCNSLTNVRFNGSIDDWCVINFECDTSNPLYYAKHFCIDNEEQTAITIKAKNIDKYVFYNCKSIQSVTIESGVTHIEANAFYGCINLASAMFKDTVGWYNESNNAAIDITDATANAAKLRTTGNGNWGDSSLRKK
ncbi:MAG: leucine-rich repeat domain-containing protein [Treponema sp.]|nr:leucine-rich repeat domain-containing protein [Treponema sp.]